MSLIDTLKLKLTEFKERFSKPLDNEKLIENAEVELESNEVQSSYRQAMDFESSMKYMVEQSNKRAYLFAMFCGVMAVLSIVAVMLLTPLKTTEPYLVRVNDITGAVDIVTILDTEHITNNEALDKHFVSAYVRAREGYYYDMLNRDYELVNVLSSDSVASDYKDIYKGDNARDKVFSNKIQIGVDVLSIVLTESNGVKTATIRTNLKIKNITTKSLVNQYRVITLSYEYQNLKLDENLRHLNPLGFKVLTYRTDEDIKKGAKQ